MLPPLPEVNPVDHPVNGVIAQVRVNILDKWVELPCCKGTLAQEKLDRAGKDAGS